jgi:hypothetical protein
MPLDEIGARYAQNLFTTRLNELSREYLKKISETRQGLASRGFNANNAGFYHSQMVGIGVEHVEALADAQLDALLSAYAKSGLTLDDAAVEDIRRQTNDWVENQAAHLAERAKDEVERSRMPVNMVPHVENLVRQGVSRIMSQVMLKLHRLRDEQILASRPVVRPRQEPPQVPTVFISCGQYTLKEIRLGKALAVEVTANTACPGYFAENQNTLENLTSHIFNAINNCAGLVAVLHRRGQLTLPNGSSQVRASIWIEQEIAIAAFLAQVHKRQFPIAVYIQKGIKREGVREQLRIDAIEFDDEAEVIEHFKQLVATGQFKPSAPQ